MTLIMNTAKKRKIKDQCSVFNNKWTTKHYFSNHRDKAVCLLCRESVAVFKGRNLERHHQIQISSAISRVKKEKARSGLKIWKSNKRFSPNNFFVPDAATKASLMLFHKIVKWNQPFSDGEFVKECLTNVANIMGSRTQKQQKNWHHSFIRENCSQASCLLKLDEST